MTSFQNRELTTLSSSISILTGFSPPAISKFYCAYIMIASTGSCIGSFLFHPILVRKKLWIFLSFRTGSSPLILVSWKLNYSLFLSLLTKNFDNFSGLIILNASFFVFFIKKVIEPYIESPFLNSNVCFFYQVTFII